MELMTYSARTCEYALRSGCVNYWACLAYSGFICLLWLVWACLLINVWFAGLYAYSLALLVCDLCLLACLLAYLLVAGDTC